MPTELKKDFAGGQGNGADAYSGYATDHDENYTAIEGDISSLDAKVQSALGANTVLALRTALRNDPNGVGAEAGGVIGRHSYEVSINADPSLLDISPGQVLGVGSILLESLTTQQVSAAALAVSTEFFIALDINGVPQTPVTTPGNGVADIAKVTTNGVSNPDTDWVASSIIRAGEDHLASKSSGKTVPVLADGDDIAHLMQRRAADSGASTPDADYRSVEDRLIAIERLLNGLRTAPGSDQTKAVVDSGLIGPMIQTILTDTQRDALTEIDGMMLYNSTQNAFNYEVNGAWKRFPPEEMSDLDNAITFGTNVGPTAHGLFADPEEVWCYIKCQSPEKGYVPEDRVFLFGSDAEEALDEGVQVVLHETANTMEIVVGAGGISILDLTLGTREIITAGNWQISFGCRSYAAE